MHTHIHIVITAVDGKGYIPFRGGNFHMVQTFAVFADDPTTAWIKTTESFIRMVLLLLPYAGLCCNNRNCEVSSGSSGGILTKVCTSENSRDTVQCIVYCTCGLTVGGGEGSHWRSMLNSSFSQRRMRHACGYLLPSNMAAASQRSGECSTWLCAIYMYEQLTISFHSLFLLSPPPPSPTLSLQDPSTVCSEVKLCSSAQLAKVHSTSVDMCTCSGVFEGH